MEKKGFLDFFLRGKPADANNLHKDIKRWYKNTDWCSLELRKAPFCWDTKETSSWGQLRIQNFQFKPIRNYNKLKKKTKSRNSSIMKNLPLSGREKGWRVSNLFWWLFLFPANQITSPVLLHSYWPAFWGGVKGAGFRSFSINKIKFQSSSLLYVNNLCVSLQSDHSSMRQKSAKPTSTLLVLKLLPRVFKVQTIWSAT